MNQGKFIVFEGLNGCGKSSIIKELKQLFINNNINHIITTEPGTTNIGQQLREIVKHTKEDLTNDSELFLYLAARSQNLHEIIEPALKEGKIVLCDRYVDSSLAYQGVAKGMGFEHVLSLNNKFRKPDITFILNIPVEISIQRSQVSNKPDRFEKQGIEFLEKVRRGYLKCYTDLFGHVLIDATKPLEEVLNEITTTLRGLGIEI